MITYTTQETVSHVLTQEGAQIALQGSHEARVFNELPVKGEGSPIPIKELQQKVGAETAKIGQGQAFKNKWIGKEGDGLVKLVRDFTASTLSRNRLRGFQVSSIVDTTQLQMREVDSTGSLQAGEKALADRRKRKLIAQRYMKFVTCALPI